MNHVNAIDSNGLECNRLRSLAAQELKWACQKHQTRQQTKHLGTLLSSHAIIIQINNNDQKSLNTATRFPFYRQVGWLVCV